jgi:hypothetical protein
MCGYSWTISASYPTAGPRETPLLFNSNWMPLVLWVTTQRTSPGLTVKGLSVRSSLSYHTENIDRFDGEGTLSEKSSSFYPLCFVKKPKEEKETHTCVYVFQEANEALKGLCTSQ